MSQGRSLWPGWGNGDPCRHRQSPHQDAQPLGWFWGTRTNDMKALCTTACPTPAALAHLALWGLPGPQPAAPGVLPGLLCWFWVSVPGSAPLTAPSVPGG